MHPIAGVIGDFDELMPYHLTSFNPRSLELVGRVQKVLARLAFISVDGAD